MHLASETRADRSQPGGWRVSLDRAWRSRQVRRAFEAETGVLPLADTATGQQAQQVSGEMESYYDRFLIWATRHLGLEEQAPPAIRERLTHV